MPWVRFDDAFTIHRKVEGLTDKAFRLHVAAIFWCARNLTDGHVPAAELELVCARIRAPRKVAAELVDRHLWIEQPDGWLIKDYLEYQPSKEKVIEDREKAAERQRNWRDTKRANRNGSSNGVRHAVTDAVSSRSPSRPVPSRPVTTTHLGAEGGGGSAPRAMPPRPPERCEKHQDDPSPPPCGNCADHRRAAQAWDDAEVERAAAIAAELEAVRADPRNRCEHGTDGGGYPHPVTGLPLCALCRAEVPADA